MSTMKKQFAQKQNYVFIIHPEVASEPYYFLQNFQHTDEEWDDGDWNCQAPKRI